MEYSEKDIEQLNSLMEPDLKQNVEEVRLALINLSEEPLDINNFSELDSELVDRFIQSNNLDIASKFKDQLTTPFAIAKYLMLSLELNTIVKRVEDELKILLDSDKINWVIYIDFTNRINFTKVLPINSEDTPQSLLINYRLDGETDRIVYSISAGNWGWDITKLQLKALLENTSVPIENAPANAPTLNINYVDIVKTKAQVMLSDIQDLLILQLEDDQKESTEVLITKAKRDVLKTLLKD